MSSFTKPLVVSLMKGGRTWKLEEPFSYHVGSSDSADVITVPKGFVTDFASIPKIFWSIIGGPTGKYTKASVIHDYLYHTQQYSRRRTDKIFLEAMAVLKVGWFKRRLMYRAVRIGAGWIWKRRKKSISS